MFYEEYWENNREEETKRFDSELGALELYDTQISAKGIFWGMELEDNHRIVLLDAYLRIGAKSHVSIEIFNARDNLPPATVQNPACDNPLCETVIEIYDRLANDDFLRDLHEIFNTVEQPSYVNKYCPKREQLFPEAYKVSNKDNVPVRDPPYNLPLPLPEFTLYSKYESSEQQMERLQKIDALVRENMGAELVTKLKTIIRKREKARKSS